MISLLCLCLHCVFVFGVCVRVFFNTQGLGGLYQCDYPATHDSEYKEILITPPHPPPTHHTDKSSHHPSFQYCISSLCVSKHVTVSLHLLTGLTAFTLVLDCDFQM